MTNNCQNGGGNDEQEDIKKLMEKLDLSAEDAEKVRDVMEEFDLDEDAAADIAENL
ncbi:hypothetical protein GF369_00150 [Candidatus Peregrinibacteria bacterium]|nr:hypothetical protein [Candidatus Peregrinibacteria bacterium]